MDTTARIKNAAARIEAINIVIAKLDDIYQETLEEQNDTDSPWKVNGTALLRVIEQTTLWLANEIVETEMIAHYEATLIDIED